MTGYDAVSEQRIKTLPSFCIHQWCGSGYYCVHLVFLRAKTCPV